MKAFLLSYEKRGGTMPFYILPAYYNMSGGMIMYAKLIIDGDAVYETDEECLRKKEEEKDTEDKESKKERKR